MATTTKKAAGRSGKATKAKSTQAKTGAGPAIAERSKDAKPAFGKAAPRKVKLASADKPAKPAAKSTARAKPTEATVPAATKAAKPDPGRDDSIATTMARSAKSAAQVAAGAVVATAKGAVSLASSVVGGSKGRSKGK